MSQHEGKRDMRRSRFVSRIPFVSRIVVVMAAALVAVSALMGVPDTSAPAYSTVAVVSDSSPATPLSEAKCKKRCKRHYRVSDSDLKYLSSHDVESVATLGTVLAVIALAAVI